MGEMDEKNNKIEEEELDPVARESIRHFDVVLRALKLLNELVGGDLDHAVRALVDALVIVRIAASAAFGDRENDGPWADEVAEALKVRIRAARRDNAEEVIAKAMPVLLVNKSIYGERSH